MLGEHPSPTLLMSLAACESTHYVAVLQHVGCYIGMLPISDISPSKALILRGPEVRSLKEHEGFLTQQRTGKAIRVAKIGICPPALADEIMDRHTYPKQIFTALLVASVTVAGKAPILQWLKFAALGATDTSSKTSAFSITLRVCNKIPTTTAMDTVYNSLGEAMEKEKALGGLFDMVFTLPQAKPNPLTTSTSNVIDTNVLNVQTDFISKPPTGLEATDPSNLLLQNQVNTGQGLLTLTTQRQQQLQPFAHAPNLEGVHLQPIPSGQATAPSTGLTPLAPTTLTLTQQPMLGKNPIQTTHQGITQRQPYWSSPTAGLTQPLLHQAPPRKTHFGNTMFAPHLAPQGPPQGLQPPPWQTGLPPSQGFTQHMTPPPA